MEMKKTKSNEIKKIAGNFKKESKKEPVIKSGISEENTLAEILKIEGADRVLAEHHLPCMGCPMAGFEMGMLKLGDVCKGYGIDADKILEELNTLIKTKKQGGK